MNKRPRSAAQREAARRNGARSRGPLSDQARARVALNSLKHGLSAATIVLPTENRGRFDNLLSDLLADLAPQTTLEFLAVEEIAANLWKQRRAWALESASYADALTTLDPPNAAKDPTLNAWRKLNSKDFHNLILQQFRVNSQLDRAYRRFRDLEAVRGGIEELWPGQTAANNSKNEEALVVKNEPEPAA